MRPPRFILVSFSLLPGMDTQAIDTAVESEALDWLRFAWGSYILWTTSDCEIICRKILRTPRCLRQISSSRASSWGILSGSCLFGHGNGFKKIAARVVCRFGIHLQELKITPSQTSRTVHIRCAPRDSSRSSLSPPATLSLQPPLPDATNRRLSQATPRYRLELPTPPAEPCHTLRTAATDGNGAGSRGRGKLREPPKSLLGVYFRARLGAPLLETLVFIREMVGASGFEPPASWSRTRRASQAALRPEIS